MKAENSKGECVFFSERKHLAIDSDPEQQKVQ